jgi:glutamine amidotransferase
MARLFGIIGNRADLAGRALAYEAEALRVRGGASGWGIGFYQGGEVLMRRRPTVDSGDLDVSKLVADARTDVLIGQVRRATVGSLRTENTHPFRFRQWLFAQTGTVPAFESTRERMVASVPEFLRAGIRGETDAEVVFHVFLSFLHDAGRLNDLIVPPSAAVDALRAALAQVDAIGSEVGAAPAACNVLVSDRTPEIGQMNFQIVASDFDDASSKSLDAPGPTSGVPPRWNAVADRAIVTLTRGQSPKIEAL